MNMLNAVFIFHLLPPQNILFLSALRRCGFYIKDVGFVGGTPQKLDVVGFLSSFLCVKAGINAQDTVFMLESVFINSYL